MHKSPIDAVARMPEVFDPSQKWVRVTGINPQGFVEFEFAVGSPDLCVELMLRPEAFTEFCTVQGAVVSDPDKRLRRH
jgi:phenol hydroxylase P0 protein